VRATATGRTAAVWSSRTRRSSVRPSPRSYGLPGVHEDEHEHRKWTKEEIDANHEAEKTTAMLVSGD
jgi:hypothetical protein